jgi:chromate transporter
MTTAPDSPPRPTFREAFRVWLRIGLLSFGGPTGQIALMHHELVEKRRWISEARFLHALNYCMLLPGPEAQQLSVYIGWLLHGTRGGLVAGTLFVLPGALLLGLITWMYAAYGHVAWITGLFYGLKPAVLGLVAFAIVRLGKKVLKNVAMLAVSAAAFVAIYFAHAPFPLIIVTAAVVGALGLRLRPEWFLIVQGHGGKASGPAVVDHAALNQTRPAVASTVRTAATWLLIWAAPVVLTGLILGRDHILFQQGVFFSKAAVVTFGGAYAVLPYVAQEAVNTHGWVTAPQMLDGLGLAETTPGPLILVLQYVGFLGAWAQPAPFTPLGAATLGSLMTLWCTFVPSFLFIFTGAPYIEHLRGQKLLTGALSAITAAVVGVILNLALWFGGSVLWPQHGPTDWFAVAIAVGSLVALQWAKWDVIRVILVCSALGMVYSLVMSGA